MFCRKWLRNIVWSKDHVGDRTELQKVRQFVCYLQCMKLLPSSVVYVYVLTLAPFSPLWPGLPCGPCNPWVPSLPGFPGTPRSPFLPTQSHTGLQLQQLPLLQAVWLSWVVTIWSSTERTSANKQYDQSASVLVMACCYTFWDSIKSSLQLSAGRDNSFSTLSTARDSRAQR
jgi:hypothetical protein